MSTINKGLLNAEYHEVLTRNHPKYLLNSTIAHFIERTSLFSSTKLQRQSPQPLAHQAPFQFASRNGGDWISGFLVFS
jgi:hypothetical protein